MTAVPLATRLDAALASPPPRPFLDGPQGRLGWAEMAGRIGAAQAHLATLPPGARILIGSGDEAQDCALLLAALRLGVPFAMVDRDASTDEIARLTAHVRPVASWLRPDAGGGPALPAPCAPRSDLPLPGPEALAVIVFTSGTTARPKGVMLSQHALAAQLAAFDRAYGFGPGMRLFNPLPLHHVDGLIRGVLAAAVHGATLDRPGRLSETGMAGWLARMAGPVTHLVTVPALLAMILRQAPEGYRLGSDLACVISSADRLDQTLWQRFEARFGRPITNAWGQSETVCDALYALPRADGLHVGTIGQPLGCRARVVDAAGQPLPPGQTGELQISGPILMSGYLDDPEATAEVLRDGWLSTGDLASETGSGQFLHIGRKRRMIVSGGVSLHPENVDAVILALPGVAEAATLGLPDPDWGERIAVAVVAEPGATPEVAAIQAACRAQLAPEKCPHLIRLLPALPRGPSGKVVLDDLRALLSDSPPAPAPQTVIAIAAEVLRLPESALSPDSTPFNTPPWDSLAHMTLIGALETAFGFSMTAEDILTLASLGDAEAIVARHLHRREGAAA